MAWTDWIIPALAGASVGALTAGGFGGGEQTLRIDRDPRTPEEDELLAAQIELITLQLEETRRQNEVMGAVFPDQMRLLTEQTRVAMGQLADEEEIGALSRQRVLAALRGEAPPLSEAQSRLIDETFGAEEAKGTRAIRQFLEEIAASRGMRLTDSPIGGEGVRATRELHEGLAGARARAKLDIGSTQQVFEEQVRQFQEGLRQAAFQNRMSLVGRTPNVATGLPIQSAAGITPLIDVLGGQRQRGQTSGFQPQGFNYLSLLAQTGGLALAGRKN